MCFTDGSHGSKVFDRALLGADPCSGSTNASLSGGNEPFRAVLQSRKHTAETRVPGGPYSQGSGRRIGRSAFSNRPSVSRPPARRVWTNA